MSAKTTSWMVSAGLHLLVLGLFAVWQISISPKTTFTEIELYDLGSGVTASAAPLPAPGVSAPKGIQPTTSGVTAPAKIDMPATSLNQQDLNIPLPGDSGFVDTPLPPSSRPSGLINQALNVKVSATDLPGEGKTAVSTVDDGFLNSLQGQLSGQSQGNSPFMLEGEIKDRQVTNKALPVYPAGLQKTARVKLSFSVLPDGRIVDIVVEHKVDPLLEKASLDAFAQWRFAAIPTSNKQQGSITFFYELK